MSTKTNPLRIVIAVLAMLVPLLCTTMASAQTSRVSDDDCSSAQVPTIKPLTNGRIKVVGKGPVPVVFLYGAIGSNGGPVKAKTIQPGQRYELFAFRLTKVKYAVLHLDTGGACYGGIGDRGSQGSLTMPKGR